MLYGMDISSYQGKLDLTKGNYDFAIIKATEGTGLIDKSFKQFSEQLTELNKLIGAYHFARPDLHGTVSGMKDEARFFCDVVTDSAISGNTIVVLDWETEPMDNPDLIEAWVREVEWRLNITPFIYGSKSKLIKWKDYAVVKNHPLWVAVWPNIYRYTVGQDPMLTKPSISPNGWAIWQYSSTGQYPGFNGNVDLDCSVLTPDEWRKYTGNKKKEEISTDMQWAINNGLFLGYEDKTYKPGDYLTREQLATVLRRYNGTFDS